MNVRILVFALPALLFAACSSGSRQVERAIQDSVQDSVRTAPPPAVRENLSMIGAVVRSVERTDGDSYHLTIELRTALPAGPAESIAEPGQTVIVRPAYVLGEDGKPRQGVERNARLRAAGDRKPGEALIGKIMLSAEGIWLLVDTDF